MIKIKEGKYFSHPEVVAASQELDTVLDEYQVMLNITSQLFSDVDGSDEIIEKRFQYLCKKKYDNDSYK